MRKNVDTMIVVPNERLLAVVGKGIPFQDALKKADEVLLHATQGIASLIASTGIINVDFANVRTVMQNGGAALMGTGIGRGENRALEAAQQAISSPLLDNVSIAGATGVLIDIIGGDDLTLGETTQINDIIHDAVGDDAEIIFGAGSDAAMRGEVRVTVIATGFDRAVTGDQPVGRVSGAASVINFPRHSRVSSPSMPAQQVTPAAANPRVQPRAPQPPPATEVPKWKSPRSSDGRWIDVAGMARGDPRVRDGRRRGCRDRGRGRPARGRGDGSSGGRRAAPRDRHDGNARHPPSWGNGLPPVRPPRRGARPQSIRLSPSRSIRADSPGPGLQFRQAATDSSPSRITVRTDPAQRVTFRRTDDRWDTVVEPIAWSPETVRIEGAIDNSLYEALDAQVTDDELDSGGRQRLAWDLANVFAWQVDFTRDIQPGDRFEVLFERMVSPDGEERFGRVLASHLTMSGKSLTAFRFDSGPRPAYYDSAGNSLRRAFLRAPVPVPAHLLELRPVPISPVLGISRRHEGTDYAADPGTPVMAAGDGVVARAGRAGGYGNLIEPG